MLTRRLNKILLEEPTLPPYLHCRPWTRRVPVVKKPAPLTSTHVDLRHGKEYPLPPRSGQGGVWTGWLTHQEFNLIEMQHRYGLSNIYSYGERMNLTTSSAQSAFHRFSSNGVFTECSTYEEFTVSPMAMILFNMTDQYLIELGEGEDSEDAA